MFPLVQCLSLTVTRIYHSFFLICSLMEIMTSSAVDMHVRLAISALDYTKEGSARVVLSKALTATSEVSYLQLTRWV